MSLAKVLEQALKGELRQPKLREVGAHFVDIAGGPREMAKLLWQEYQKAAAGSLNRSRILQIVLQMMKDGDDGAGAGDLTNMTEEDLRRELEERVRGEAARAEEVREGGSGSAPGQ